MEDRLKQVEQTLARVEVKVEQLLAAQAEHAAVMKTALHGTDGANGLVVRVDRVEEWRKRHHKLTAILLAAVLPLLFSAAVTFLKGDS